MQHHLYHKPIWKDLRLQKGECNNLRVGLQLDKEGIAEYREGSDEYHEHGARPWLDSVPLHSCGYTGVLQNCECDQEYGAVHFPLSSGVGQSVELEEGDAPGKDEQEPCVVAVEVQEGLWLLGVLLIT